MDRSKLLQAGRYGSLAPSVHNSQPWRLAVDPAQGTVTVRRAPERSLEAGDPTGRETWLSIGCLMENVLLAAPALGLATAGIELEGDPEPAVTLSFRPSDKPGDPAVLKQIEARCSDRSRFNSRALTPGEVKALSGAWPSGKVKVELTTDRAVINLVAELTAKGIALALSSPDFRAELSRLILPPGSRRRVGIPAPALGLGRGRSLLEPLMVRLGLNAKHQAGRERELMASAPALALIFSQGDNPKFWLEAGRAYQRVAVTAAGLGLRQSTSAAVVEAADYHLDIEKRLGTTYRLQAVLRLGHSRSPLVPSPRLGLDELITSTA